MSEEQPQPEQSRELPDLFKELGQPFPEEAYKEVKYGSREFTTIDAYHIVERLTRIFGMCGIGWGWKDLIFTPYPDSVSCHGIFWVKDPYRDGIIVEIHAVGDGAIIKGSSAAEATKKAQTNMMSKAVSFIGVETCGLYQGKHMDDPLQDRAQNGTSVPPVPAAAPAAPVAQPSAEVDLSTGSMPQGPETADKPSCPQCGQVGTVRESSYGGYWCTGKQCPNGSFGEGANSKRGEDKPAATTGKKDYSDERKYWQVLDECCDTANCDKDMMNAYLVKSGMMTGSMEKWMEMQGHHKDYITAEEETFKKGFFGWLGAVSG